MVFVFSGPSGCGKTTYSSMLSNYIGERSKHSITYTTRSRRISETNHTYMRYVSDEWFYSSKDNGMFYCTKEWCGNNYGYLNEDILPYVHNGFDIVMDSIMDIEDIQKLPTPVVSVFLITSTEEEAYNRIITRDPNINESELHLRMIEYKNQLKLAHKYDYIVFTDSIHSIAAVFGEIELIYKHAKSGTLQAVERLCSIVVINENRRLFCY